MKVLVATVETQGERPGDYHHAIDGELVWIQEPCATDLRRMPNACGCGRGFAGLASHRATSTARVAELPELTWDDYVATIRTSVGDGGWPRDWAEGIARGLAEFAAEWETGAVIERDIWVFDARRGRAIAGGTLRSWVALI